MTLHGADLSGAPRIESFSRQGLPKKREKGGFICPCPVSKADLVYILIICALLVEVSSNQLPISVE